MAKTSRAAAVKNQNLFRYRNVIVCTVQICKAILGFTCGYHMNKTTSGASYTSLVFLTNLDAAFTTT
jgi:hypothetical protein